MRRIIFAASLLTLILVLPLTGCKASQQDSSIEEVLQINNDILEDPLLKELDLLEASLLAQDPISSASAEPAALEENASAIPPEPAQERSQPTAVSGSSAEPSTDQSAAFKRIVFGKVKKATDVGIALRVIQAKALTPDELKRIKNGEKIPRTLLTDEVLNLDYSGTTAFEKIESGTAVPAQLSDVASGQTVRVTLNQSGKITLLRIIRN